MFAVQKHVFAIRPKQYCFRPEIVPSQLICTYFELQKSNRAITAKLDTTEFYGQDSYLQVSNKDMPI